MQLSPEAKQKTCEGATNRVVASSTFDFTIHIAILSQIAWMMPAITAIVSTAFRISIERERSNHMN
jgi:hypothetical protein